MVVVQGWCRAGVGKWWGREWRWGERWEWGVGGEAEAEVKVGVRVI